jgi:hypothetical protein
MGCWGLEKNLLMMTSELLKIQRFCRTVGLVEKHWKIRILKNVFCISCLILNTKSCNKTFWWLLGITCEFLRLHLTLWSFVSPVHLTWIYHFIKKIGVKPPWQQTSGEGRPHPTQTGWAQEHSGSVYCWTYVLLCYVKSILLRSSRHTARLLEPGGRALVNWTWTMLCSLTLAAIQVQPATASEAGVRVKPWGVLEQVK